MLDVQFRGRRVCLWPAEEAPLGRRVDPEIFLRREREMRTSGFTVPLERSEPMLSGASNVDEPWQGPFDVPGLERLGTLWLECDGTQLLLRVVEQKIRFGSANKIHVGSIEPYCPLDIGPMTEDGHVYYACITSSVRNTPTRWGDSAIVTVLFPHMAEGKQSLLRPVAVYAKGRVKEGFCGEVVSRLITAFEYEAGIRPKANVA